jgi:Protein of unknown function (DUF3570)
MRLRQVAFGAAALAVALFCGRARADRIEYTAYSFRDDARNKVATTSFSLLKTVLEKTRILLDIELDQTTIPPLDAFTGASRPARQSKTAFLKNRGQIIAGVQQDVFANTTLLADYYFSQEVDYRSQSFVGGITQSFAEKNFTVELLGQFTQDSVGEIRANGALLNHPKETHKGSLRITQLLTPVSYVRMGVDAQRDHGFLSDPYRTAERGTDTLQERVPGMRYRGAGWIEYDRFLAALAASWSAEYRYAMDDWDLKSHMVWLRFNKYITPDWIATTQYRYYIQNGIDFGDYAASDPSAYFSPGDYKLQDAEYNFIGIGLTGYLRAFCRNHPTWDFLRRSSVTVKYTRYFNGDSQAKSFAGNLLETRLRFDF